MFNLAQSEKDDAIRSTDDDAASSRLSAVNLGYLNDPFSSPLYRPPLQYSASGLGSSSGAIAGPSRKPPLINVGTHHRSVGLDMLVEQFLAGGGDRQILSLGSGSDTRFWRLMAGKHARNIKHYVEVDFPHKTSIKAGRIARSPKVCAALRPPLPGTSIPASPNSPPYTLHGGGTTLLADRYSLVPLDLREEGCMDILEDKLDPKLPTLLLAECVFCYITPEETERVLRWFGRFHDAAVVVYEMIGIDQVMRRNLAARNLSLPGAIYRTATDQAQRLLAEALGEGKFDTANAKTLWQIRNTSIPPEEIQRISALEHLDEIEELRLVLDHYCIAWGCRGEQIRSLGI